MSDLADIATGLEAEHLALSLSRISSDIPAGHAGECDECGADMPRLVDGRCGFCRDGRRPPGDRYPDPAAIAELVHQQEETSMPTAKPTDTIRTISVPAKGAVLVAIEKRAADDNLPLGQATSAIVADWITAAAERPAVALLDLSQLSTSDLLDEIGHRLAGGSSELVAAAVARADALEGQMATLKAQIGQLLGGVA